MRYLLFIVVLFVGLFSIITSHMRELESYPEGEVIRVGGCGSERCSVEIKYSDKTCIGNILVGDAITGNKVSTIHCGLSFDQRYRLK